MTKTEWPSVIRAVLPAIAAVLAAYLAARPLLTASRAERDVKLVTLFTGELMGRAHARADRPVGVAEQNAALVAIAGMGERYPDVLLEPGLAGLQSMDRFYTEKEKESLPSLPGALARLEAAAALRRP